MPWVDFRLKLEKTRHILLAISFTLLCNMVETRNRMSWNVWQHHIKAISNPLQSTIVWGSSCQKYDRPSPNITVTSTSDNLQQATRQLLALICSIKPHRKSFPQNVFEAEKSHFVDLYRKHSLQGQNNNAWFFFIADTLKQKTAVCMKHCSPSPGNRQHEFMHRTPKLCTSMVIS